MLPNTLTLIPAGLMALATGIFAGWMLLSPPEPPSLHSVVIGPSAPPAARSVSAPVATEQKPIVVAIEPPESKIFPTRRQQKKVASHPQQNPVVPRADDDDDD